MTIYTIGFAGKSAAQFFALLRQHGIGRLLDVRLHNRSQLCGFTKARDLEYFLRELCGIEYRHELLLAPDEELFRGYKHEGGDWAWYQQAFRKLMVSRQVETVLDQATFQVPTVLLCSEASPDCCHRRVVAEYLAEHWPGTDIVDL